MGLNVTPARNIQVGQMLVVSVTDYEEYTITITRQDGTVIDSSTDMGMSYPPTAEDVGWITVRLTTPSGICEERKVWCRP